MLVTVEEAGKLLCPLTISRVATGDFAYCAGPGCMAWRYKDHSTDEAWIAAVRKTAEEMNDTTPNRTKAARAVMNDRAKYGLPIVPERGWCVLAGKPEWWPK